MIRHFAGEIKVQEEKSPATFLWRGQARQGYLPARYVFHIDVMRLP